MIFTSIPLYFYTYMCFTRKINLSILLILEFDTQNNVRKIFFSIVFFKWKLHVVQCELCEPISTNSLVSKQEPFSTLFFLFNWNLGQFMLRVRMENGDILSIENSILVTCNGDVFKNSWFDHCICTMCRLHTDPIICNHLLRSKQTHKHNFTNCVNPWKKHTFNFVRTKYIL